MLIDVGAYFINTGNVDMAKKIIELCPTITDVIYINNEHKQMNYNKKEKASKEVNKIESTYWKNPEINVFIYFDQSPIVGQDIKQIPLNARGLVTLKYYNFLRDYGQGAYRLRKINMSQSVDICIDATISKKIELSLDNNTNRYNLLEFLTNGEDNNKKKSKNCRHYIT